MTGLFELVKVCCSDVSCTFRLVDSVGQRAHFGFPTSEKGSRDRFEECISRDSDRYLRDSDRFIAIGTLRDSDRSEKIISRDSDRLGGSRSMA